MTTVTTIHATANIWIQGRHQHDMRVYTDTFIDKKYHIQTRVQNTSVFIITGKEETQRHGAMEFTNIADSPGLVIGRKVDVTTVTTTSLVFLRKYELKAYFLSFSCGQDFIWSDSNTNSNSKVGPT